MARSLASLFVSLGVKSDALNKGFDKARKKSKTTFASIGKNVKGASASFAGLAGSIGRVAAVLGPLGSIASIAGITALTKQAFELNDRLGKVADTIGETTENLFAFRRQADRAGISVDQVDKALLRFQRNIGDALSGTGEAVQAFERLELSARDLSRLSPVEAFNKVSEALSRIPNRADRAALAYRAFGRQGQELLRVVEAGIGQFDSILDRVTKSNQVLSRLDIRKIEAANDAFADLKDAIGGISNTLAVELAPSLKAVSDSIEDILVENKGFASEVATAVGLAGDAFIIFEKILKRVQITFLQIRGVSSAIILDFVKAFNIIGKKVDEFGNSYIDTFAKLSSDAQDVGITIFSNLFTLPPALENNLRKASKELLEAFTKDAKFETIPLDDLEKKIEKTIAGIIAKAKEIKEAKPFGEFIRELAASINAAIEGAAPNRTFVDEIFDNISFAIEGFSDLFNEKLNEAGKSLPAFVTAFQGFADAIGVDPFIELVKGIQSFVDASPGINEAIEEMKIKAMKDELKELIKEAEEAQQKVKDFESIDISSGILAGLKELSGEMKKFGDAASDITKNVFQGMEDALVSFTTNGKFNFNEFRDSVIQDMLRIAARAAILRPLSQALGGFVGNIFGGAPNPAVASTAANLAASALAPASANVNAAAPAFAPSVAVSVTGGGEGDELLARKIGREVSSGLDIKMSEFMRQQMRPGGVLT